jgi:hypothetical protein
MTPAIHQAMVSLQEAAAQSDGGYGPLVLAKTMIMVWLFYRSGDLAKSRQVTPGTRQAIEKAQSILEKNMTDPPPLEHLATEIGMSLSKFKQVFPIARIDKWRAIAKRLPADWCSNYNLQPVLLETFVKSGRFKGTCYKAANWILAGQTKGRGKLSDHKTSLPKKDIWFYPLIKNIKQILLAK